MGIDTRDYAAALGKSDRPHTKLSRPEPNTLGRSPGEFFPPQPSRAVPAHLQSLVSSAPPPNKETHFFLLYRVPAKSQDLRIKSQYMPYPSTVFA